MSDWAIASGFRAETFGTVSGSPNGTTVTSSATAHTKGPWTQIAASTTFDASAIMLQIDLQYQDTLYLIDVGIGGAGSEQVLIPNLMMSQSAPVFNSLIIPVNVPAGSRIAVRSQDNFGSSTSYVAVTLLAGGWASSSPFNTVTAYGPSTATSNGVIADAGATINTKGAWAQITASTASAMKALMISGSRAAPGTAVTATYAQLVDIGIGAAGSEQVILPNLRFQASIMTGGVVTPYTAGSATLTGLSTLFPRWIPPIMCDIPAGVRLAVRQQSSTTNTNDRTSAYAIYGLG